MIKLDPNSWQDVEWWFEDEPEVFEFMRENEDKITQYALENGMTIKDGIRYLFKVRNNKRAIFLSTPSVVQMDKHEIDYNVLI